MRWARLRARDKRRAAAKRKILFELLLQDPHCYLCGVRLDEITATLDHYVPRSRGGGNGRDNLKLCCLGCNGAKKDMMPDEFRRAVERGEVRLGFVAEPVHWRLHYRPAMAGVAI